MEALTSLKSHYDAIVRILDQNPHAMPNEVEREKESLEAQKLYLKYFDLAREIDDILNAQNIADTKEASLGAGGQVSSEVYEKVENGDLKALLSQTSQMNAVNSAGQFVMHKRDVNDRMASLAFKMQKVYNLDKKKGPASEVYEYFMKTFDGIGQFE